MSEFPKDDRSDTPLAVIVLAAGHGTRMQSELPKVLHQVGGLPMIDHVLDTVEAVSPAKVVVVIGPDMEDVGRVCRHHTIVVCLLYTSPSPRDATLSRMPSSA